MKLFKFIKLYILQYLYIYFRQEKREEEEFKEWISRRESLNAAKRLNKCRVPLSKGKAPLRGLDNKRKNSPNPDQVEDSSVHSTVPDIVIKTEVIVFLII